MRITKRIGLPQSTFHVVNRGARKTGIFTDDEERGLFVRLLGEMALKNEVEVIAWCLMSNHFHIQTRSEGTPLTRMMHDLEGPYARLFNEKHDVPGCLFQGPFRSFSIADRDEDGRAYVTRYIHCNPIDMGFAPEDYPWSSCRSYLGIAPVPKWLNPMPVLETIGGPDKYLAYLRQARSRPRRPEPMEDFLRDFLRHLEERVISRLSSLNGELGRVAPQTVVAWAALRVHKISARLVADHFGYSSTGSIYTILDRFDKRLESAPALRAALEANC